MANIRTTVNQIFINQINSSYNSTFLGIDRLENPDWSGWKYIDALHAQYQDTECIKDLLINNRVILEEVYLYYSIPFKQLALDELYSQVLANIIFKYYKARGLRSTKYFLNKIKNLNKLLIKGETKLILTLFQLLIQHIGVCYERKPILTSRFLNKYLKQLYSELETIIDIEILNLHYNIIDIYNLKIALDTNEFYAIPKLIYQV